MLLDAPEQAAHALSLSALQSILAENQLAQLALERERQALVDQERDIRERIAKAEATTSAVCSSRAAVGAEFSIREHMKMVSTAAKAGADAEVLCSACSKAGQFSNAQLKRPASVRRCKDCVRATPPRVDKNVAAGSPAAATEEQPASVLAVTDPWKLAGWRSLHPGAAQASAEDEAAAGAARAFEDAISPNAKNVLASHREMIEEMPAWIQWCVSAATIVGCSEQHASLVRFVLCVGADELWKAPETLGAGQLVIDVLGTARVASPALAAAAGHADVSRGPVPLLLVRYMVAKEAGPTLKRCREAFSGARPGRCTSLDAAVRAKEAVQGQCREAAGLGPGQWARTLRAQTVEEIDVALECLRQNDEALPAEYRAAFYQASRWHEESGSGGFRCSFLTPPVVPQRPRSVRL